MTAPADEREPTEYTDRDGSLWTSFSGIWYRKERNGGYGECRGTLTMLNRDFGPLTPCRPAGGDDRG